MSQVTLQVGGKQYTVACAEGEEQRVAGLGALIDSKLQSLGGNLAPTESQNLLFAALLLADELKEQKGSAATLADLESRHEEALSAAKREADLAAGERDKLKLTLSERESELDTLQSSHQRASAEFDDLRSDLVKAREKIADLEADILQREARITEAEKERDGQVAEINRVTGERNRIAAERDKLFEDAKKAAASSANGASSTAVEKDLAPALEKFADALEECADKLEQAGAAS